MSAVIPKELQQRRKEAQENKHEISSLCEVLIELERKSNDQAFRVSEDIRSLSERTDGQVQSLDERVQANKVEN
jgi:hypothetical protein